MHNELSEDGADSLSAREFVSSHQDIEPAAEGAENDVQASADVQRTDPFSLIRIVSLSDFEKLGHIPRGGSDPDFRHGVTGLPNEPLAVPLCELLQRRDKCVLAFVSHRWLRPSCVIADGHPDNAEDEKHTLIVQGLRRLEKAMLPTTCEVYIWLDFSSIDQDSSAMEELKYLREIVAACDILFTPVVDEGFDRWELSSVSIRNLYEEYLAESWHDYLNRGWCRMEMFFGANVPVDAALCQRGASFKGALKHFVTQLRSRPHVIYGTKEQKEGAAPRVLPPMQSAWLSRYSPADGRLTVDKDREIIKWKMKELETLMQVVEPSYTGDRDEHGKPHGFGVQVFESGDKYVGQWEVGAFHGNGVYNYVNGGRHQGEYRAGSAHGQGVYYYANGSIYSGEFEGGQRCGSGEMRNEDGSVYNGAWRGNSPHGEGEIVYPSGDRYCGTWKKGLKHGFGKEWFVGGDVYEGDFLNGLRCGRGTYKCVDDGSTYVGEWQEDVYHGQGIEYYKDGTQHSGMWEKGEKVL